MFCINCGTKIKKETIFCQNCGNKLVNTDKEETIPTENTISDFKIKNLFNGRIGRKHWVLGIIFLIIILFGVTLIFGMFSTSIIRTIILLIPIYILYILFLFSFHIRRLHDLDYSGWAVLVFFIPLINLILLSILLFFPGKEGVNRYGSVPNKKAKLFNVLLGKIK